MGHGSPQGVPAKGFVLDDERLKNPPGGVPDYFDELLERIRDIRASEADVSQGTRYLRAGRRLSARRAETLKFFQIVQNKLHWAATGKTAAELIAERADHTQPNMGLTSWKGAKVRKTDVAIARTTCAKAKSRNSTASSPVARGERDLRTIVGLLAPAVGRQYGLAAAAALGRINRNVAERLLSGAGRATAAMRAAVRRDAHEAVRPGRRMLLDRAEASGAANESSPRAARRLGQHSNAKLAEACGGDFRRPSLRTVRRLSIHCARSTRGVATPPKAP